MIVWGWLFMVLRKVYSMDKELIIKNVPLLFLPFRDKQTECMRCLMAGPLPIDPIGFEDGFGYWLSDIILMPSRKFSSRMDDGKTCFSNWRYHDILEEPSWPNPKNWVEEQVNDNRKKGL